MGRLTEIQRGMALGLIEAGWTYRRIAIQLNCHHTTISNLHEKYLNRGIIKDLPKSGRPRVSTNREDGVIRAMVTRKPTITGK